VGFFSCGGGDGPGYIPSGLTPSGGDGSNKNLDEWNAAIENIISLGSGTSITPKEHTITVSDNFSVPGNISFASTFGDVQYISVTLAGTGTVSLSSWGSLFYLAANQTLIIDGPGLVLQGLTRGQNGATMDNGAATVFLNAPTAKLELRNGTISGNSNVFGGGVNVNFGSFSMSGTAKISGNSGSQGGGVNVNFGSFDMSGGEISGNSCSISGGGVSVDGSGSFSMSGTAKISGNSGTSGGGVYVYDSGSFDMSGGEISGNSSGSGGGVYVRGTFTMSGGTISGNSTNVISGGGGGVWVNDAGTFNKSGGGIIYGYDSGNSSNPLWNKANNGVSTYGHAVYFYKDFSNYYYYCDTTLDDTTAGNISTGTLPPLAGPGNTVGNWIKK
jgi:hypothetical protein